jgi:hypothetical protein
MVLKLESLSQCLSAHDVVVTGSERTGSRLAVQAPVSVSSERLPAADPDRFNPQGYPATGITRSGLRAGRSVGSDGSLPSRRLPGLAGATSRTRGAKPPAAKRLAVLAQRGAPVRVVVWCPTRMRRTARTATRRGLWARPVI